MFLNTIMSALLTGSYSEYLVIFTAPSNREHVGRRVGEATGSESFHDLACKAFKPMLVCDKPHVWD